MSDNRQAGGGYGPPAGPRAAVGSRDRPSWDRPQEQRDRRPVSFSMDRPNSPTLPGSDPRLAGRSGYSPSGPPPRATAANNEPLGNRNNRQSRPDEPGPDRRGSGSSVPNHSPVAAGPPPKDPLKDLISVLDHFSTNVTSVASLTIQRDVAERQRMIGGQEQPSSSRNGHDFPALDKHQEYTRSHSSGEFNRLDHGLDEALKQHISEREKLSYAMAVMMKSGANPNAPNNSADFANHLKEIRDIKADLGQWKKFGKDFASFKSDLKDVQRSMDDNRATAHRVSQLLSRLEKIEDRVDTFPNLRLELSKVKEDVKAARDSVRETGQRSTSSGSGPDVSGLKSEMDTTEGSLEALQKSTRALVSRVETLERNDKTGPAVSGAESSHVDEESRSSIRTFLERMGEVQESVKSAEKTLRNLQSSKQGVTGKPDGVNHLKDLIEGDEGLVHSIAQLEETNEKFRNAFQRTDEELEQFDQELGKFSDRLTKLESSGNPSRHARDDTTSMDPGPEVAQSVTRLGDDLDAFRSEQQLRDDVVTDEIEKVSKSAEDGLTELRQKFRQDVSRIDEALSNLQRPALPLASPQQSAAPSFPSQRAVSLPNGDTETHFAPPGFDRLRQTLDQLYRSFQDHENRLRSVEQSLHQLGDRFNHTNTDQLKRSIVSLMVEMYPYASNIQSGFESMKQKNEDLRRKVEQLSEKVDGLGQGRPNSVIEEDFDRKIQAVESKIEEFVKTDASGATSDKSREGALALKDQEGNSAIEKKTRDLQELIDQTVHDIDTAVKKVEDLNAKVDAMWEHSATEFATISSTFDSLVEKNSLVPASPSEEEQKSQPVQEDSNGQIGKRKDRDETPNVRANKRQRAGEDASPNA